MHDYDLPPQTRRWCGDVTHVTPLEGGTSSAVHEIGLSNGTRLVLRRYMANEWRGEEPAAVRNEAAALRLVSSLPAPRVIKIDADGTEAGAPAVLMTRVPGQHDWRPDLEQLAALLPRIHALEPANLPEYATYGLHTRTPPPWTSRPRIWQQAFALFDAAPPPHETTLIHRDFHPGNVLWQDGKLTGIVDWVLACRGAPQADVGHCRWNLARTQGPEAADAFLKATGLDYHPYWDVVAALGGQSRSTFTREDEAFLVHALK